MFLYKSLSFRHEYGVLRLFYLISELNINNIMFIITMKFNGKNNTKNMPNEICGTWPACAQAHFSCHFHVFCFDRILLFFDSRYIRQIEREKKITIYKLWQFGTKWVRYPRYGNTVFSQMVTVYMIALDKYWQKWCYAWNN